MKEICETKYERMIEIVNFYIKDCDPMCFGILSKMLEAEPFIIARIYGLFKVHKDYPIRPIISSTNCMGKPLERWVLAKLNVIAKNIDKYQIRSAQELFDEIDGKKMNGADHVLVTWDFENMFTNIPFQKTKEIIRKYYHLIREETYMPVDVFLEVLSFLIEDIAFFSFDRDTYLQTEGLSMGNSLSQVLAEITTSCLLNEAISKYGDDEISFLYKYVDDIIGGINKNYIT